MKTYDILTAKGLPIPADLKQEIEGMAGFEGPQPGDSVNGIVPPSSPGDEIMMPPNPSGGPGVDLGGTSPISPNNPQRGMRPEQSDEVSPIRPPGQMPMLPAVPGIPGVMGPGTARPVIGPSPTRGVGISHVESPEQILLKLPRQANRDLSVPNLTDDLGDDTVEDTDAEA